MERLQVENFLTIREANLDLKRINIFIGPQARGKSILAKLIYFFERFLSEDYVSSISQLGDKRQLQKESIARFEELFPRYAWGDGPFSVVYQSDDVEVSLKRVRKSGKSRVIFDYSKNLTELHRRVKAAIRRRQRDLEPPTEQTPASDWNDVLWKTTQEYIYEGELSEAFRAAHFIPASRSFFAAIQKNVFSFLASNIPIDPLIKEFGSKYESGKYFYTRLDRFRGARDRRNFAEKIREDIERILLGQYHFDDDQDWIVTDERKINLINASSGQQESLPMLLVLLVWSVLGSRSPSKTFFIEEPEAHLFPFSQKRIVDMLSRIYSQGNERFVLTTHSPYILTAFNNLILAAEVERLTRGTSGASEVIGSALPVNASDVTVYTIDQGKAECLMDESTGLVDQNIIDSVSEEFSSIFDALLAMYAEAID